MLNNQTLSFPLATAINFFSTTGLLIIAGLFGKEELSAEIAIAQGAILAIFLSLSGNARNLILSDNTNRNEKGILSFRLIVMLPAVIATFYLAKSIIEIPMLLILGLILRKATEWLAEIELASREKSNDFPFARRYIFANTISFLVLMASFALPIGSTFYCILYLWAITPAFFLLPSIFFMVCITELYALLGAIP